MWKDGFRILQNIQDIFNLKKMPKTKDNLLTSTTFRSKNKGGFQDDENCDEDIIIPENLLQMNKLDDNKSEPNVDILTTSLIKAKGKDKPGCEKKNLVNISTNENSIFSIDEKQSDSPQTIKNDVELTEKNNAKKMCNEDSIISMIIDTSWYLDMDKQLEECIESFQDNEKLPTLSYFAKNAGNGLDEKQTAAYEIICASFILKSY